MFCASRARYSGVPGAGSPGAAAAPELPATTTAQARPAATAARARRGRRMSTPCAAAGEGSACLNEPWVKGLPSFTDIPRPATVASLTPCGVGATLLTSVRLTGADPRRGSHERGRRDTVGGARDDAGRAERPFLVGGAGRRSGLADPRVGGAARERR